MGNENWLRVPLYKIINILNGYAFKSQKYISDGIRVIRIANVQDGYIEDEKPVFYPEDTRDEIEGYLLRDGDLLMSLTGNVGRVAILDESMLPAALNQRVACLRIKKENILDIRYLFYYFQQHIFQKHCIDNAKGTAQLNMSTEWLKKYEILLPTLAEQQRIVEQIESLFAKLDEAKEKVQSVVDNYEVRRAAIMHKAFTGELTRKWREEKGISIETWEEKTLQEVCAMKITDGTHNTPTYCEEHEGVPFISAKDVNGGYINWDDIKYIPHSLHEELYARLAPQVDDVLLSKNGAKLGVAAIVECEKIFDIYVTLALLRPNTDIVLPRFLLNIINSPICRRQIDNHLTGIGMPNLHLRDIKQILINVPSIEEQAAITDMVDILVYKENQVKNLAEFVVEKIDELKKSILAKGFRGELGTNNHEEESTIKLLKQIIDGNL